MIVGPYQTGPNPGPENGIYTGDARELALSLPDRSIDLIMADPIYQRMEDYRWLAETATRVLTPGGSLIVQCAHEHLIGTIHAIGDRLDFVWPLVEYLDHDNPRVWNKRIFAAYKPWLWYSKGKRRQGGRWVRDLIRGTGVSKSYHIWGDSTHFPSHYIAALAPAVTLDPFTGGATIPSTCKQLGREYIAFELNPKQARSARIRVECTPDPLPQFEQIRIEGATI